MGTLSSEDANASAAEHEAQAGADRGLAGLRVGWLNPRPIRETAALVKLMRAIVRAGARIVCWVPSAAEFASPFRDEDWFEAVKVIEWPPRATVTDDAPERPTPTVSVQQTQPLPRARPKLPRALQLLAGARRDALRFAAELVREQPDILHVQIVGYQPELVSARRLMGSRVIARNEGDAFLLGKGWAVRATDWWLKTRCMHAAPRVVFNSATCRDRWCRMCLYPVSKTAVIYNGVAPHAINKTVDMRTALGVASDKYLFTFAGNLVEEKGVTHLVSAVAEKPDAFAAAHFVLCGAGDLAERLPSHLRDLGIEHLFTLAGFRRDLPAVLAASDCFVLPSLTEGLPNVVVEAMHAGLPVIATDVGGTREAVEDGINGWLLPAADVPALRAALLDALRDRSGAAERGRRGQAIAQERFSVAGMEGAWLSMWAGLNRPSSA